MSVIYYAYSKDALLGCGNKKYPLPPEWEWQEYKKGKPYEIPIYRTPLMALTECGGTMLHIIELPYNPEGNEIGKLSWRPRGHANVINLLRDFAQEQVLKVVHWLSGVTEDIMHCLHHGLMRIQQNQLPDILRPNPTLPPDKELAALSMNARLKLLRELITCHADRALGFCLHLHRSEFKPVWCLNATANVAYVMAYAELARGAHWMAYNDPIFSGYNRYSAADMLDCTAKRFLKRAAKAFNKRAQALIRENYAKYLD